MAKKFTLAALAVLALATGAVTLSMPTPSDAAKTLRCVDNSVSAFGMGQGTFGLGTRRARTQAISHWQHRAGASYGRRYADWSKAVGAQVDCKRTLLHVRCMAIATPCRARG